MATDAEIGENLYRAVHERVEADISKDSTIQRIMTKVGNGTATHADTERYAQRLGKLTSKALESTIKESALPNGALYYDVAKPLLTSSVQDNYVRIKNVATSIQETLNKKAGLGLRAVKPKFGRERINGLISQATETLDLAEAKKWLGSPIENITQSFADEFIKENADFHYNCGLTPTITRYCAEGCCPWCADMEGTHKYPVSSEIYRRHENCRCIVEYDPADSKHGDLVQNVWTKEWDWSQDQETLEKRRTYGL